MIKTKRILRAGMTNFWRNSAVAIASIFVLSTTLFVIGALYLGNAFLNSTLDDIKSRVDISVTFKPEVSEDIVLSFKNNLEALDQVESVTYSSKEEELTSFRERHAEDFLLIQSLDEVGNPFGD
ncbi:MAG: permease-like cell division protein FtsX [Candidatus Paceibacterota bacterium]